MGPLLAASEGCGAGFGVLIVDNPQRARESGRGAVRPIIAIFHCGVVIVAAATLQQQGWGALPAVHAHHSSRSSRKTFSY